MACASSPTQVSCFPSGCSSRTMLAWTALTSWYSSTRTASNMPRSTGPATGSASAACHSSSRSSKSSRFLARKRARNLLDFDDLLLLWQAALADPVAGPVLRGMFDAVLVDEYQDVNAVQASIVRLLQPDGKQLTCVGDDAQAIYGFRGADPAHLRQLTADYQGLDIVRLDRNYRSRQGVLDLANVIRPSSALPGGARGGRGS